MTQNHVDSRRAAVESAWHLALLLRTDGRFNYRYDASICTTYGGYNLVRHAGCAWILAVASLECRGNDALRDASLRAIRWITMNSLTPTGENGLGVVEDGCVKLGANALAILAIVALPMQSQANVEIAQRLSAHIWSQQLPSGDFAHKWHAETGRPLSFVSAYYTGEALFAMLTASAALGDDSQFSRARSTLIALADAGYGILQQSHWMMYAVETCDRTRASPALYSYVGKLIDNILTNTSYRARQRSTPVACRTEALLSYLRMPLARSPSQMTRAAGAYIAIEENLAIQLGSRLQNGAFRKSAHDSEVRIDYLQHNIQSLLGHARLLEAKGLNCSRGRDGFVLGRGDS
jgi:hypothetical protein